MSWEKLGITIHGKLSHTGGSFKVTIPKKTVEAYDLWAVDDIEVRIERVRRPPAAEEKAA